MQSVLWNRYSLLLFSTAGFATCQVSSAGLPAPYWANVEMSQILKEGQKITTESSRMDCTVFDFLGGGGQGEVYRTDLSGREVALTWYLPGCATPRQRATLELLIRKGPPTS